MPVFSGDDVHTQMRCAANDGDLEKVKELLQDGANINTQNDYKNTALHMATFYGHEAVVKHLVQAGAKLNIQNVNGQTPVQLAAVKGHLNLVKILTEGGCQLDKKTDFSGMTALHMASKEGHAEICQYLLDMGATEEIFDQIEMIPEYYAANVPTELVFRKRKPQKAEEPVTSKKAKTTPVESEPQDPEPIPDTPKSTIHVVVPIVSTDVHEHSKTVVSESSEEEEEKKEYYLTEEEDEDDYEDDDDKFDTGGQLHGGAANPGIATSPERRRKKQDYGYQNRDPNFQKLKNHEFEWSETFKKRQHQSVFSRLGGGGGSKPTGGDKKKPAKTGNKAGKKGKNDGTGPTDGTGESDGNKHGTKSGSGNDTDNDGSGTGKQGQDDNGSDKSKPGTDNGNQKGPLISLPDAGVVLAASPGKNEGNSGDKGNNNDPNDKSNEDNKDGKGSNDAGKGPGTKAADNKNNAAKPGDTGNDKDGGKDGLLDGKGGGSGDGGANPDDTRKGGNSGDGTGTGTKKDADGSSKGKPGDDGKKNSTDGKDNANDAKSNQKQDNADNNNGGDGGGLGDGGKSPGGGLGDGSAGTDGNGNDQDNAGRNNNDGDQDGKGGILSDDYSNDSDYDDEDGYEGGDDDGTGGTNRRKRPKDGEKGRRKRHDDYKRRDPNFQKLKHHDFEWSDEHRARQKKGLLDRLLDGTKIKSQAPPKVVWSKPPGHVEEKGKQGGKKSQGEPKGDTSNKGKGQNGQNAKDLNEGPYKKQPSTDKKAGQGQTDDKGKNKGDGDPQSPKKNKKDALEGQNTGQGHQKDKGENMGDDDDDADVTKANTKRIANKYGEDYDDDSNEEDMSGEEYSDDSNDENEEGVDADGNKKRRDRGEGQRRKRGWGYIRRPANFQRLQDHEFEWSEKFRQRQKMSVVDRLAAGGGNKGATAATGGGKQGDNKGKNPNTEQAGKGKGKSGGGGGGGGGDGGGSDSEVHRKRGGDEAALKRGSKTDRTGFKVDAAGKPLPRGGRAKGSADMFSDDETYTDTRGRTKYKRDDKKKRSESYDWEGKERKKMAWGYQPKRGGFDPLKDHDFIWSDEYKARQRRTVFDRLLSGRGKKTKPDKPAAEKDKSDKK